MPHSPESRRIVFVGDYKWESIFSVFNPHLICYFCSRTRTTQQIESDCVLCHYDRRSRRALIKFIVPNSIYVNQQAIFSLSLSSRSGLRLYFNLRIFLLQFGSGRIFSIFFMPIFHQLYSECFACPHTSDRLLKLHNEVLFLLLFVREKSQRNHK